MKEFVCDCGKKFNGSQSYNGHKRHCKVGKSVEQIARIERADRIISKISNEHLFEIRCQKRREKELEWGNEIHWCETCGKKIIEKFASGRFCCRSCANKYSSKIAKKNKSSFKAFNYGNSRKQESPYERFLSQKLREFGFDFIWNATRKQYTDIKGHTYTLDFYLPDFKLDLEYDGRLHKDKKEHDKVRDLYLNSLGIEVYRIQDYDTDKTLDELFKDFLEWFNLKYIAV